MEGRGSRSLDISVMEGPKQQKTEEATGIQRKGRDYTLVGVGNEFIVDVSDMDLSS